MKQPCCLAFRWCNWNTANVAEGWRRDGHDSSSWLDRMAPSFLSLWSLPKTLCHSRQIEETCLLATGLHPTLQTFSGFKSSLFCSEEHLETATTEQQSPMHQANLPLQIECVKQTQTSHNSPSHNLKHLPNLKFPHHEFSLLTRNTHGCLGSFGVSAPC